MKKKDFIYYASAALLLAVSVRPAYADEQESAVQPIQVKAEQAQDTVAKTASDDSERVESKGETGTEHQEELQTEQKNESSQSVAASLPKQSETKVENQSASLEETTKREETSKVEEVASTKDPVGKSTFFNAGHTGPASRSSDVAVQPKTFVDVSSHNGSISVNDYRTLANKGVGGVVVKLTEGTTYRNPYAGEQARNAQLAGLQVSAYAFSHYTNEEEARAEARYFASRAKSLNLSKNTVMVNDMEDPKMKDNINPNTYAWADEMRKNGYTNLMYYTSASWIDENNLRGKGPVKTAQFGLENFWVAQYPTSKLSVDSAKALRYNGRAGAWQFTSQAELLPGKHVFDHSVDYTGRFTSQAKPAPEVPKGPLSGKITIENNDSLAGRFDVVISNALAPHGVASVTVPVWSDLNGQDDLVWYGAVLQKDGRYRVTVKASDHKNSTGKYHVHLYYTQLNGEQIGVTATTTEVSIGKKANKEKPSGKVTIENNNSTTGTFDAVIRDVVSPNGPKEVLLPTWSDAEGQDDIIWYKAIRQADGTYKASIRSQDHKNSTGLYHIHLYYRQNDDSLVGVGNTSTKVVIKKAEVKPTVSIHHVNEKAGVYTVSVKHGESEKKLKQVRVAAWSQEHQENLFWYITPATDLRTDVTVNAANHKSKSGDYTTHVYLEYTDGTTEGYNKGVVHLSPSVAKPSHQKDSVLREAASLVGIKGGSEEHKALVNDYNSVKPLPVGYAVKESDDWCDIFTTVVFQRQGLSHLVGRECGVERHIQIFKKLGIWNEDGASTPKAGDIITFNWDKDTQQNDGWADHIGIVEKVENGIIHTIEGNSNNQVRRNVYQIGHGNIRGFASPQYQ